MEDPTLAKEIRARLSTIDREHPQSTLLTGKADNDFLSALQVIPGVEDPTLAKQIRARSLTIERQHPQSTLLTGKADKGAVVHDRPTASAVDFLH